MNKEQIVEQIKKPKNQVIAGTILATLGGLFMVKSIRMNSRRIDDVEKLVGINSLLGVQNSLQISNVEKIISKNG